MENRTAVVTGVGPGMGTDISLQLAEAGADLVLVARSDRVMPDLVGRISDMGRRCVSISADVCSPEDRTAVADLVHTEFGQLDILVNSAFHGGRHEAFADADLAKWQRPFDVNFFGTLGMTQALLPALRRAAADRGDARIVMVNTMSIQHLEATHGSYAASKAALGAITKTLALELGAEGIRVNAVHPGYIWGDSVKTYFEWQAADRGGDATWEDVYAERAAETALGYLPHSSEIAGAVVFFASPLAKCVTGTALPVNAGHWMPPSA